MIEEGEVHVWRVQLDGLREDWSRILQPEEIIRAARFFSPVHQERFKASRGMLRILLSRYLGVLPKEIRIATRPAGKPFIEHPECDLRFNVSHSHDVALYAFAISGEVGVDVERKRPSADMEDIGNRFFSPGEAEMMRSTHPQKRLDLFYRLWTLKEAYAKGTGDGIAELLRMEVLPDAILPAPWRLHVLDFADDFSAAVAVEGERRIQLWDWPSNTLIQTGCSPSFDTGSGR